MIGKRDTWCRFNDPIRVIGIYFSYIEDSNIFPRLFRN